jgi:hypothetical protein
MDLESLRASLLAMLSAEGDPISLKMASRQIGYDTSQLYRYCPEQARALSQRYKAFIKARRENLMHSIETEVRNVTRQIHADGVRPSRRAIMARLGNPGHMNRTIAIRAWRETLAELGLPEGRISPIRSQVKSSDR